MSILQIEDNILDKKKPRTPKLNYHQSPTVDVNTQ